MVAGWGATMEGGITADRLQEVEVEVTEAAHCRQVYRQSLGVELPDSILCAGLEEGGKDACQVRDNSVPRSNTVLVTGFVHLYFTI